MGNGDSSIATFGMGTILTIIIAYGVNRLDNTLKEIADKLPDKTVQIQENVNPSELEGKLKNTYLCYETDNKFLCKPYQPK